MDENERKGPWLVRNARPILSQITLSSRAELRAKHVNALEIQSKKYKNCVLAWSDLTRTKR